MEKSSFLRLYKAKKLPLIQYLDPSRSIKSWQEAERPRERLLDQGPEQLTLAEILGIIIQTGYQHTTAIDIAREILQATDYNLHALARWDTRDFLRFKGIGPAKAVMLVAALELTRRRTQQQQNPQSVLLDSSSVYTYLRGYLADLDHEEFWIICLDQAKHPLARHLISKGGITGTVVDNRIVFRYAINTPRCVALVLAHNHPSGQLRPSTADIQLTKKISSASKSLDLQVLDHLIIGQSGYYSFADEGML